MQGETFYEVDLSYINFENIFPDEFSFRPIWLFEILDFYQPKLILPKKIIDYAENGLTSEIEPFVFVAGEKDYNTYIANDRVGLRIR